MRDRERCILFSAFHFLPSILYNTPVYSFHKLVSTSVAVVPFLILPFFTFLTPRPPNDGSQQASIF